MKEYGTIAISKTNRSDFRRDLGQRSSRFTVLACFCFLLGCLFSVSTDLAAQTLYETEPNNTVADANAFSGSIMLMGSMSMGDRDTFKWSISDEDAQNAWNLVLTGIPGQLTKVDVFQVNVQDQGNEAVDEKTLFTLRNPEGNLPGRATKLIFEPGDYLLIISMAPSSAQDGSKVPDTLLQNSYRLAITEAETLHARVLENNSRDKPHKLIAESKNEFYTQAPSTWTSFTVPNEADGQHWRISGHMVVGRQTDVLLHDADKVIAQTVTNDRGEFILADVGLKNGVYWVELQSKEGGLPGTIELKSLRQQVRDNESEPNDNWKLANRIELLAPFHGHIGDNYDFDYFIFAQSEQDADYSQALKLEGTQGKPFEFCLFDGDRGIAIQCRTAKGQVSLEDLALDPGDYGLRVAYGVKNSDYTLRMIRGGPVSVGQETEPNDEFKSASGMNAKREAKGQFAGDDTDYYHFTVTGVSQLWQITALGDGINRISLLDSAGVTQLQSDLPAGATQGRLPNVLLLPGTHYLSVRGNNGAYRIQVEPLGAPVPDYEQEPNNDKNRSQPLGIDTIRAGSLQDDTDRDYYHFSLSADERIRLTIEPPKDGSMISDLDWEGKAMGRNVTSSGNTTVLDGVFPPGNYALKLSAAKPSDADYRIKLERPPRFSCPTDCEPNNSPAQANVWPLSNRLKGMVGEWRDQDWYQLPVFSEKVALIIEGKLRPDIRIFAGPEKGPNLLLWDSVKQINQANLLPNVHYLLQVAGNGQAYQYDLHFSNDQKTRANPRALAVSIKLNLDTNKVAAYRRYGQHVSGKLMLTNEGRDSTTVTLEAVTNDYRWHVDISEQASVLQPGERRSVPIAIRVPKDAWADTPVRISIRAFNSASEHVETWTEIQVDGQTRPVNPVPHWDIPKEMLGGVNAAWTVMGGQRIADSKESKEGEVPGIGRYLHQLFDARVVKNEGAMMDKGNTSVTVQLAGTKPVKVVGIQLNPLGRRNPADYLKQFELQLSDDGQKFETVLRSSLIPLGVNQTFTLAVPQPTRFARLIFVSSQNSDTTNIGLGEWKVIASPGTDLSSGKGFDLALPEFGGHVVWSEPVISSDWDRSILTKKADSSAIWSKAGQGLQWVIGFQHERAAQVTRMEWIDSSKSKVTERIDKVSLAVAMQSPTGPWQTIGEWQLTDTAESKVYELEKPVWARYIRFSTTGPKANQKVFYPEKITILERAADETYRSILGEWGSTSHESIYEHLSGLSVASGVAAASGNNTQETALALQPAQEIRDQVTLGKETDWYKFTVSKEHNSLQLQLGGDPTVRTVIALLDADGGLIPVQDSKEQGRLMFKAAVTPGASYFIKVEEPPRSVVFAWDNSGSVSDYSPLIYRAINAYAVGVEPGRDVVNLLVFGGDMLMKNWVGDPTILHTILNDYPRTDSSSNAEAGLALVSDALSDRVGTKAIVLITDAATSRESRVWESFNRARPRIFAVRVGEADDEGIYEDLMQTWAMVNDGYYEHIRTYQEMDRAFDRAAILLRQPADYTLQVSSRFEKAPGPGTLQLVTGDKTAMARVAVELILDASGSMLKHTQEGRRIDVAKKVLAKVAGEHIPPGTPVALRAFGHKNPGACQTELVMPLKALAPDAMKKKIQAINAKNLAKTPIADSLLKVESDLKRIQGKKIIVLITDGKETCDGDPSNAIKQLAEHGVDLVLNIVGFAIDDAQLERQFEVWAKQGGGHYFNAADATSLQQALRKALKIPFTVYDQAGSLVTFGEVDGEPVSLEVGQYRVQVASSPPKVFEKVEVAGEEHRVITLE